MNKEKNFKNIKKSILTSGIPLEYSICQILKKFEIVDLGEYLYERDSKIFSIDIHGNKTLEIIKYNTNFFINIDLLIECKYRDPNKQWHFINFGKSIFDDTSAGIERIFSVKGFETLRGIEAQNLILDFPMKLVRRKTEMKSKYSPEEFRKYLNKYMDIYIKKIIDAPIAHKGIEILVKGESNKETINKAIFQMAFGVSKRITEILNGYYYIINNNNLHYILPIIVTTADLFVMKKDVSIEDIKKANNYNEIFDKVNSVVYDWKCPKDINDFIRLNLDISGEIWDYCMENGIIEEEDEMYEFTNYSPNRILIINYNEFDNLLKIMLKNIEKRIINSLEFYSEIGVFKNMIE